MNKSFIIIAFAISFAIGGCGSKDEGDNNSKNSLQILADKEKEINDREARVRLKEIELEEREKRLNLVENGQTPADTTTMSQTPTDTSKQTADKKETKQETKKEIQKEITKKFENPTATVKDYYEYIKRAINETGNFDANMKKAHNYFPSRSSDKMKANYKNVKNFTIVEEPKVVSQKDGNATVTSKVKQVDIIKKEGKDEEVTRTMTVTYKLTANSKGEWVITSNLVKIE
ncbi:MAG: hypothetical protein EHM58_11150 [Ignavibacteriae bacterium]|nr:MAG: hypothetical protein EHM58_11150 [Ignavibacteriota bacterium]